MNIEAESDLDLPVWTRTADVLEGPQFSNLRKLLFRIDGEASDIASRRITEYLRRWDKSGVLKFFDELAGQCPRE